MDIEKQLGIVNTESWDEYDLKLVLFNVEIKDSSVGLKDGKYYYVEVCFYDMVIEYAETEESQILFKSFKLSAC
ncbi:hypothetical protein [Providencia phage PSTCR6]|nr:hypothetical protein [Providencia phage PSTCR6]